MTKDANIHASCVAIGRQGVLLLGKSGAGKSDLALRLIDGGARLVADDRTILFVQDGTLRARAPASIKGLLEIRNVGIVKLPVTTNVRVALVVELGRETTRLPVPQHYKSPVAGAAPVPLLVLDPRLPATPAKIRTALAAFSRNLFRDTFDPH